MAKKKIITIASLLSIILLGCKAQSAANLSPKARQGKKIYEQRGCGSCHKINGKGGRKGPDLTRVGNKLQEKEWYQKYFRNPTSVVPNAKMPKPLVTDEEMDKLIEYMLSLK